MTSRLIVRNIPTHMTEAQLKDFFEKKGEVTDIKIIFKGTQNRRFCYVGYKKESDATKAKDYFNNTFIHSSRVKVDFAHTKDDPNLPRAWSRFSKDSSAYQKKFGVDVLVEKKVKKDVKTKDAPKLEENKSEKFKEFLKLMKQQNTAGMSWNDNIDVGEIDNPKARQKMLKEMKKKQKKLEELQQEAQLEVEKKELEDIFQKTKSQPTKAPVGPPLADVDERRLYVTNIPYTSTEQDLREIFERFGTVLSLKIPKQRGGSLSGFCFVQFSLPEEAMRAFSELDNKIVLGRIMHVRPAYTEDKKPEEDNKIQQEQIENEKTSFKKAKKIDMLKKLEDPKSWNTLFLNPNTIVESLAARYGLSKREILEDETQDLAIKMTQMETQVVKETKDWMKSLGMNIDFFKVEKGECNRSNVTLIIKNLQYRVTENDLNELFGRFGKLKKVYLSPNKAVGIVQFENTEFANNAFSNLSYFKYKGSPLYLEWAPLTMLKEQQKEKEQEKQQNEEHQDTLNRIIYVKNLNFESKEKNLKKLFEDKFQDVKHVTIVRQSDGLSMGYGFVEFGSTESAGKAIRQMNDVILDGHALKLSQSKPNVKKSNKSKNLHIVDDSQRKQREEIEPSNKIVIRNLPFETNLQEIRNLLKGYGEIKRVRMPKKLNGQHRGFAFAELVSVEEAQNVYESIQNSHFYGRRLVVEYAKDNE